MGDTVVLSAIAGTSLIGIGITVWTAVAGIIPFVALPAAVVVSVTALARYDMWGSRARAAVSGSILMLVAGLLVPYWTIVLLSGGPDQIVTSAHQLTGVLAGVVVLAVGLQALPAVLPKQG